MCISAYITNAYKTFKIIRTIQLTCPTRTCNKDIRKSIEKLEIVMGYLEFRSTHATKSRNMDATR